MLKERYVSGSECRLDPCQILSRQKEIVPVRDEPYIGVGLEFRGIGVQICGVLHNYRIRQIDAFVLLITATLAFIELLILAFVQI